MNKQTWLLIVVMSGFALADRAAAQTLVPNKSTWKYLHPTDGVDPAKEDKDFHTTFHKADFDDSAWKTGADKPGKHGGFGYGDKGFEGVDLGAPEEKDHRKTAYLRLKFKTDKAHEGLLFKCQRDDGVIVYLDGKEVLRDNVQKGDEAYDLFADEVTAGESETQVNRKRIKVKLAAGEHVLAISLHNRKGGSSDLRIAEISLEVAKEGGDEKDGDKKDGDKKDGDKEKRDREKDKDDAKSDEGKADDDKKEVKPKPDTPDGR